MKFVFILIGSIVLIASCQKELSEQDGTGGTTNPTGSGCKLTRIVQGTGIDDTVYLLKYDTENRISTIIDSVYEDTLTAQYISGRLHTVTTAYGDQLILTNNSAGKSVKADTYFGNRYTMDYTSDTVLTKVTSYFNDNNVFKPYRYYTFESNSNGDLTLVKEYTPGGVLAKNIEMTYTTIPNVFAELTPFNMDNYLGMEDVLPAWFTLKKSKFLVKTYKETDGAGQGGYGYDVMYTLDNSNKLVSSVAVYTDFSANSIMYTLTRNYFYECN